MLDASSMFMDTASGNAGARIRLGWTIASVWTSVHTYRWYIDNVWTITASPFPKKKVNFFCKALFKISHHSGLCTKQMWETLKCRLICCNHLSHKVRCQRQMPWHRACHPANFWQVFDFGAQGTTWDKEEQGPWLVLLWVFMWLQDRDKHSY